MGPDEIYYYHLRIGHGVTFAYYVKAGNWVQYSYAICSSKDQYCKAFGRDIAEERLICPRQKKVSGFRILDEAKRFQILRHLVTHFLMNVRHNEPYVKSPSWLRKTVKLRTETYSTDPIDIIVEKFFPSEIEKKVINIA